MKSTMEQAIIKKDLKAITSNSRLFPSLIIVPLIFTIVFPIIFILSIVLAPNSTNDLSKLLELFTIADVGESINYTLVSIFVNNIMPMFFIIIPIMSASIISASSFVGEKEKRTLETLLYCPLPLKKIFRSKVFSSLIFSMLVTYFSFILMVVVVQSITFVTISTLVSLSLNWILTLLLVSPSTSLLAITLIVGGSAKAQTVEESQQRAVFLILPIVALLIGQFLGVLLINAQILLIMGIIIAVLGIVLLKRTSEKFTYERLLK